MNFVFLRGFTLIELIMVMAIIILTVAVVIPRLPDFGGFSFDRAVRKSSFFLQAVRQRAVAKQRYYRIVFSLEDSRLTADYYGPENLYVEDDEVAPFTLPAPARIQDVVTTAAGKTMGETAYIHISPRGMVEPSAVHLGDGKNRAATLLPELLSGGVEIVPGYQEFSHNESP